MDDWTKTIVDLHISEFDNEKQKVHRPDGKRISMEQTSGHVAYNEPV
jgi:hypothetical protein